MPNWTDDSGFSWFNVLQCKRCSGRFEEIDGEVPEHDCIEGRFKSESKNGQHHQPVKVKK